MEAGLYEEERKCIEKDVLVCAAFQALGAANGGLLLLPANAPMRPARFVSRR